MLEQLLDRVSPINVLIFAVVVLSAYTLLFNINEERKIRRLGFRAPQRKAWLPYCLDILVDAVTHAKTHRSLEFWLRQYRDYGNPANPYTVELGKGNQRIVFTSDPENIKAILATQFNDYGKGEEFLKDWEDFLGHSIFTTDGTLWHDSRQLIRPQFIKDRVSDLHTFEKHCTFLIPMLGGDGREVDVVDLFFRFTLDAATDFLLGRSVDSLHSAQVKFADSFNEAQRIQSLIARVGPMNKWIPRKNFFKAIDGVNEFVEPFIDEALRLSPEELEKKSKSDEGYSFLHAIAGYTRNRRVLRDQLIAVLLAGRDTTACTLSWTVYEISKQPQIVQKLRKEIEHVVGWTRAPTYDDLKSMRYLQHTLNETLRLYPVVPFNVRLAFHDTTLPHGGGSDGMQPVGILKNNPVGYSALVMQRREDLYPPGFPPAKEYVPERWDHWTPKAWTYIPFNGGPRICVGQQFALTEMAYTLVRILQKFSSIVSRMTEPPKMKADIVLQPFPGVNVAFFEDTQKSS